MLQSDTNVGTGTLASRDRPDRPAPVGTVSSSLDILNALDQVGVLLAVFLPYRLHRLLEGLLVVDLDDLDAGLLDLFDRFLLHRIPELSLVLLRLLGELHDQRLVILAEGAPDLLREHEDLRDHQVTGE